MPDEKSYTAVLSSPVGYLGVQMNGEMLCGLEFLGKGAKPAKPAERRKSAKRDDEESADIQHALDDYFSDPCNTITPATILNGTVFQKKVWQILAAIKPGHTRTYGDIARQLNSSPRAVGNACRSNPVPIFIPCHRVVSASGRGGFMGHTTGEPLEIKEWLLTHEARHTAVE